MAIEKNNLSDSLNKLSKIVQWFESQENIDIEKGLDKVREGMALIRSSKEKFKKIENEFEEIKKEFSEIEKSE